MRRSTFIFLGLAVCGLAVANDRSHAQTAAMAPLPGAPLANMAPPMAVPANSAMQGAAVQSDNVAGLNGPSNVAGLSGTGNVAGMNGAMRNPALSNGALGGGAMINAIQAHQMNQAIGAHRNAYHSRNVVSSGIGDIGASNVQLRGTVSNATVYQSVGRLAASAGTQIVQDAAGSYYLYESNGRLNSLPPGTNISSIMLGGGTSATMDPEKRKRMYNPHASRQVYGPMTFTHTGADGSEPLAIASRQYLVNGQNTAGGGSVIREYPTHQVQSFARVYKRHAS